jgi:hypothetical protein
MHTHCRTAFLLLMSILAACADGGDPEVPASEVIVAANHHLFWFRGLPGFGNAASRPEAVNSGSAILAMRDDSLYTLTFPNNSTSSAQRYALANTSELNVYQSGGSRDPTIVFQGSYQLLPQGAGNRPELFFTDRVSFGNSPSVGLYVGTKVQPGQDELEGAWRLFSLHVMLQPAGLQTPRTVARAAYGEVSIAAGAPGTARAITGTGFESGSDPSVVPVAFSGSVTNVLDGQQQGNGACLLTIGYTNTGSATDSRVFNHAAAGRDLLLGVDEDESDTASGLSCMMRKFDAPATPADPAQALGTFLIGGMTVWVNPTNAGSDGFVGELTLSSGGAFRMDAVGYEGIDFSYQGSYTLAQDGGLTLQVTGNGGETWQGAISRNYDTLMVVDPAVEVRANNRPEINYLMGVRKRTPPP